MKHRHPPITDKRKTAKKDKPSSVPKKDRPKLKYKTFSPSKNGKAKKTEGEKRPDPTIRVKSASGRADSPAATPRSRKLYKPVQLRADTTKKVLPPKKRKPRTPPKPKKVFAAWVVFNNKTERVETFPYPDKAGAERCLAKLRGKKLKDGSYENGTFYLNLVKEG